MLPSGSHVQKRHLTPLPTPTPMLTSTPSCLSGRWQMLEKQIFILVFARVYICVLFFSALQNMRLCVGCRCRRAGGEAGFDSVAVERRCRLPCPEIFRDISHKTSTKIYKFVWACSPAAPTQPSHHSTPSVHLSFRAKKMAARSCRFYTSYCVRVHETGNLIF